MAAKPHFAASVQSKKGRLYAVMQVKKDGTTKPVWRALGLPEGANKTKVNKAFREVVARYEQEFWEEQERGGRPPADIPVYDYLVSYLKRVEPELQKNTIVSYRSMTNGKIRRYFQRRPQLTVGNLKPQDIQDFYQSLFADGVVANTVIHYHALLRRAFQQAFKEERIDANPFDRVGRPKKNKFHGENYTQEELLTLLHLARGDVIYPAILLAGAMGLRRSEALGVRWSRIDWEKRTVLLDTKIVEYRENGKKKVEPVEEIVKRFKTGAMSYGSISQEAHETLAIAMNHLHGKSNSGEGGESDERLDSANTETDRCSAIKQVASGRFGVTSRYLVSAKEIQIKLAQGAKPGEGGHLPGKKVYPWVAKTRHSTPGVSLISPPPHHDIYSIEDLAQLIYDLKNANKYSRISVKLVSEAGVGTVAAGVAKAGAQVILISGYDGGTGAAPESSIHNAGLPWELGLAETHQTLIQNGLRERVKIETDGKLMSGRDVAIAALLGAEEFGFATAPLVTLGCVMMRVCNLDTCPVGIATQNPELRKRFQGKPEYVENFMRFVAQELREYMAKLGVRTVDEMVGRTDLLKRNETKHSRMADKMDLGEILYHPAKENVTFKEGKAYDFQLEKTLDERVLLKKLKTAVEKGNKAVLETEVKNIDRSAGTILGAEITRFHKEGLPEDTIVVNCKGVGGQSFGAFIPKGLTMTLCGDTNDYYGKGLSGGKLVVYPPKNRGYKAEENIIVGNVALYGATAGKVFINGVAGERFAVRNSGAYAVVEGVGEHGCEYMTGGRVAVLGKTGKNFAAGMSGGIAYVLDENSHLYRNLNKAMIAIEKVENKYDIQELRAMIEEHVENTGSARGKEILADFDAYLQKFKKIIPHDYKKMIALASKWEERGMSSEQAQMEAFNESFQMKESEV